MKILLHTKATRYLDFKAVDGRFVVKKGAVCKVRALLCYCRTLVQ